MIKEFFADISALLFFASLTIPYMILTQLFLPNSFSWAAYILPLLFGLSSSYVINKGHDSGFLERTLVTSAVISVVIFISIYQLFFVISDVLLNFQKNIKNVPTSQLPDFVTTLFNSKNEDTIFQTAISSTMITVGAMADALLKTVFRKK